MKLLQKNKILYWCCLLLIIVSCHDKEALKQEIKQQMIKEKIESHKRQRILTCYKNAVEEAIERADSLMIKEALQQIDTTNQVMRPTKPKRPDINLPVDTTPIKPLFKDSISLKEN